MELKLLTLISFNAFNADPAEMSRTGNIPVSLQESFPKFDESLRILEEKFQSNEKAVMETEKLIDAISEGESVEEEIQNLLKDLDPYDDEHGDTELARRIDKLSISIPEIPESELLRRVSLSADEIARCNGNTTPRKSNVNEGENTKQRSDSASNTVTAAQSAIRPGETERLRREIKFSLPRVGIMPTARSTPLVTRPEKKKVLTPKFEYTTIGPEKSKTIVFSDEDLCAVVTSSSKEEIISEKNAINSK